MFAQVIELLCDGIRIQDRHVCLENYFYFSGKRRIFFMEFVWVFMCTQLRGLQQPLELKLLGSLYTVKSFGRKQGGGEVF
jgi:hypothetical protein